MDTFKITRIFADPRGESHFQQIDLPLDPRGEIGFLSKAQKVGNILFRKVLPSYDFDFHHAPARQYIILLDGEIEIEVSNGEKQIFGAGEVLLVEDTWGKGHKTRNLRPQVRSSIFVTL